MRSSPDGRAAGVPGRPRRLPPAPAACCPAAGLDDDVDGALNIYSRATDAFDDGAVLAARAFAGHAAVTVANARRYDRTAALAEQMRTAMESCAVIEQAKGIVMAERRCTAVEAFAILTRISKDSNRKLRDVAAALAARAESASRRSPR